MRVGILMFDEVEVLDACGPFEVFSVAARLHNPSAAPDNRIEVEPISAYPDRPVVVARGGLRLGTDSSIADAPELDLLIVPGGVTTELEQDEAVLRWIGERAATTGTMASVCTGAFLFAAAGVITDHRATTHWEDVAELRERFPALDVVEGARWVESRGVYTSAGISAAIDIALHLVDTLVEPGLGAHTAHQMDYAWRSDPTA